MHEVAPEVDVDMQRRVLEDHEGAPEVRHDLAPREILEVDSNIQRDLQWCVQRRLIVEVTISGSTFLFCQCVEAAHGRSYIVLLLWMHGRVSLKLLRLCRSSKKTT